MSFLNWITGDIVSSVGDTLDNLFTSDDERLEKENELKLSELNYKLTLDKMASDERLAQIEVNKEEAKSSSWFVSSWRPACAWVCVTAMFYQFILYPLMIWLWTYLQSQNYVPPEVGYPPILDTEALFLVLSGLLGLGGFRTFEKMKNIDTKQVGK